MKNIIFLFVALAMWLSCSKGEGISPGADEREVEMNFLLPASARAGSGETEWEKAINSLTLLVFDGPDDDSRYLYSRYAWRKSGGTFSSTLRIGEGFTVYFAANAPALPDILETAGDDGEWTWKEVRESLQMDGPQDLGTGAAGIPMWGHRHDVDISDSAGNHLGTIQLVRSVASVDIYMLADDFEFRQGFVVFAASRGYLPYDRTKMEEVDGLLRSTTPYCPDGFNTLADLERTVENGSDGIINQFYIYENDTPLAPADRTGTNRPTKVVLKGIWKGDGASGRPTYYPLTIRDYDKVAEEFVKKQVTRNNKYSLFIKKVHGDGYGDLGEAKEADDANWDYDVVEWNDNEDGGIIVDGPKYFWREATYVTVGRTQGSIARLRFRTNYRHEDIKMKFAGDADYSTSTLDTHDRFRVEIIDGTSASSAYDFFKITAKKDYGTGNNPALVNVLAGRTAFNIHLEQIDRDPTDWNDGGNIDKDL